MNISEVITICGELYNITLIGRKGFTKYNSMPTLRQLGYAIDVEPFDNDLEDFVVFDKVENTGLSKKAQPAWDKIHREDEAFLDRKDSSDEIPYTRWVMKRVETLLLPYP